jgi:hypothetical protein
MDPTRWRHPEALQPGRAKARDAGHRPGARGARAAIPNPSQLQSFALTSSQCWRSPSWGQARGLRPSTSLPFRVVQPRLSRWSATTAVSIAPLSAVRGAHTAQHVAPRAKIAIPEWCSIGPQVFQRFTMVGPHTGPCSMIREEKLGQPPSFSLDRSRKLPVCGGPRRCPHR